MAHKSFTTCDICGDTNLDKVLQFFTLKCKMVGFAEMSDLDVCENCANQSWTNIKKATKKSEVVNIV